MTDIRMAEIGKQVRSAKALDQKDWGDSPDLMRNDLPTPRVDAIRDALGGEWEEWISAGGIEATIV